MSGPDDFVLIVQGPDGSSNEHVLGSSPLVVGRDDSADIRVDDRKISRRHASFRVADGQVWVEDLGSVNGLRLNGKKIKEKAVLLPSDVINLGAFELRVRVPRAEQRGPEGTRSRARASAVVPVAEPTRGMRNAPPPTGDPGVQVLLVGLTPPVRGRRFTLGVGEGMVGRLDEHAVPLLDGSVSRNHARIVVERSGAVLENLSSSNGSFVNGIRIDRAELAHGDRLRFGTVELEVELGPGVAPRRTPLEASRIQASIRTRAVRSNAPLFVAVAAVMIAATGAWAWYEGWVQNAYARLVVGTPPPPEDGPAVPSVAPTVSAASPAPSVVGSPAAPTPTLTAAASPRPSPSASSAPPTAATPVARPVVAVRAKTATAPFGRRDAEGRPLELPSVDAALDFDGLVTSKLDEVTRLEGESRFADVRKILGELVAVDPINGDAHAIRKRVDLAEKAQRVLEEGDSLRAQRQLMKALELYQAVPSGTPQRAQAEERLTQLRPVAIAAELELVNIALKRPKTWPSAHERLVAILEVDPNHAEAKQALGDLEEKLRKDNVSFVPYGEQTREASPGTPALSRSDEIAKRWDDRVLQRIVVTYADGDLRGALRRAEGLARKAKPKSDAKGLFGTLKRIESKYERARNELANDPAQAWAQLIELGALERELLPEAVKSFLVTELERAVADAFAVRGERLFSEQRYEQAFQQWDSGAKLQPGHPRIREGLAKLEETAEGWAKDAELMAQRGQPDACEAWKRITRMTRAETEVHKKARARIERGC